MQRELDEVNHRYVDLRKHLSDQLDDLRVGERVNEETEHAQTMLDWVVATNSKLDQAKPRSTQLQPLREEVQTFKVLSVLEIHVHV